VLVTNGGKQAVANAFAVLCDPGDEVLVLAPYWTTYPESIALAGGVPVMVSSDESQRLPGHRRGARGRGHPADQGAAVRVAVQPDRGRVPARRDRGIGQWAVERGLWVLTDEIYEHLVYGGAEHHSMPVVVPELADRCLVVNGVAKTYAMTGWRVGWLIGPPDAITAATNIQSHETSNVANVSQRAALAAVSGGLDDVAMMRAAFDRRRQTIVRMLNEIDGVVCVEPEGAFYAFPSVKGLLGKSLRGTRPRAAPSWPSCASTRPRSRSSRARPSAHRGTSACPTPGRRRSGRRGVPSGQLFAED
jgi:aspartate aminotransferase